MDYAEIEQRQPEDGLSD